MTTKQVQLLLAYLGYDVAPDGIPGPQTTAAVRSFQSEYGGLAVDGDAGPSTQAALKNAVADGWTRPTTTTPQESTQNKTQTGTFWDEIKYFTRNEFACRCGQYHTPYCNGFPVEPDETLVRLADRVRSHFGRPAHPTSGIRCARHNADQPGSASNSKHMSGKALDFWVEGVSGSKLLTYAQSQPETSYAYIVEDNIIHMDVN